MPSIIYDLNLGGISGSFNTQSPESYNVTHLVTGVTGTTAIDRLRAVMTYLAGLGFVKGAYADSASDAWLRDIQVKPIGGDKPEPDKFVATLIYRTNPFWEVKIESNTALSQTTVTADAAGDQIQLEYTYPADWLAKESYQGETIPQGGEVDKLIPEAIVTFRIREEEDPALWAGNYVGKVNSANWRDTTGGSPGNVGEWMCTSINGYSDNSGVFFENAYSFQHRPLGYDVQTVYHDPTTGRPPPDVLDQPAAYDTPVLYEQIDFNNIFDFSG